MWSEIHIPDETDLPKALENGKYKDMVKSSVILILGSIAGLKTMEVFEKKITSDVSLDLWDDTHETDHYF